MVVWLGVEAIRTYHVDILRTDQVDSLGGVEAMVQDIVRYLYFTSIDINAIIIRSSLER